MPANPQNLRGAWRPGQSGNPSGRPALPEDLKGIKALTVTEANHRIAKYARMTFKELQTALTDDSTSMIDRCIAKIFEQSAEKGDYQRLSFLLDRAIGKVPVAVDDDDTTRSELQQLSTTELLKIVQENIPQLTDKDAG